MGNYLLNDLNLSGEQMLGAGLATGVGGYAAGRGLKAGGSALLNKFMGGPEVLKNIAVAKVLEEAAGVTPVFVTNWPGGGDGPSLPGNPLDKKPGAKKTPGVPDETPKAKTAGWLALASTALALGGSTENTDEGKLRIAENSKIHTPEQRSFLTAYYRNRIDLAQANPDAKDGWLSEQARALAQQQTGLTASGGGVGEASAWARRIALAGITKPAEGLDLLRAAEPGRNTVGVMPTKAQASSEGLGNAASLLPPGAPPPIAPLAQWAGQTLARFGQPAAGPSSTPALGAGDGGQDAALLRNLSEVLRQQIAQMEALVGQPLVVSVRSDSDNIFAEVERRVGIQERRG